MATDLQSPRRARSARAEAKRELIVRCAMRHFAEHGYQGARIEDMATELQIAKGSIFQHYGSKAGLFLEAYRQAVAALPRWLDAPDEVLDRGFFEVVRHWLERTEHLVEGGLGPVPRDADRHVRHRPVAPARDQPLHGERGPLRHARVHRVGAAARRGARRPRPRDRRVDGGLAHVIAAGRASSPRSSTPGLFHRWEHQPERQRMRLAHFESPARERDRRDQASTSAT